MKRKNALRLLAGLLLTALLLVGLASPAQAYTTEAGDTVVVEEGQVIEGDYYVTANIFTLKGTIKGDLIAFGSLITIDPSGVVEGDLLGAGQVIQIRGAVLDDVRVAGMLLSLTDGSRITGDLVAMGYSLDMAAGSTVAGDALFLGGSATISGSIAGNLDVAAGGVRLEGSVGGDMTAEVGAPQPAMPFDPMTFVPLPAGAPRPPAMVYSLSFGPNAKVGGDLDYTSPSGLEIPDGVVAGQVHFTPTPPSPQKPAPVEPTPAQKALIWLASVIRNFVTLLVLGLLFAYLGPKCWRDSLQVLKGKPWHSLAWGVLGYIGYYLIVVVIFIVAILFAVVLGLLTLGKLLALVLFTAGLLVANLTFIFYALTAFASKIVVAGLVGVLIFGRLKPAWNEKPFIPLLLGLLIYVILAGIPILGALVNLLAILFGLGALLIICYDWWKERRAKPFTVPDLTPIE